MEDLPGAEEDKLRFRYRHNSPYSRQPRPGQFGQRQQQQDRPSQNRSSEVAPPPHQTETPPGPAGPFVTVARPENRTERARQPKQARGEAVWPDYRADSRLHEVRVPPPSEFHHLLARVDGVGEEEVTLSDSLPAESRRRRPRQQNRFRGVPGTAGRDFPTLGSIPMTKFSCIGTNAGFYADLETNCQVGGPGQAWNKNQEETSNFAGVSLLSL